MKIFNEAAAAAIEKGEAVVHGAVRINCDPVVTVWSGAGRISIDGEVYEGLGHRGLAQISAASLGSAASSVSLKLSGIDPTVLELLDADELRSAAAIVYRLIFDSSGTQLLDAHVFTRGRVDQVPTDETIGGEASIGVTIEGAARGLGRRGGRMRTDADQRLVKATDGGFSRVSFAGEKTLYWGGQRPARVDSAIGANSPRKHVEGIEREVLY